MAFTNEVMSSGSRGQNEILTNLGFVYEINVHRSKKISTHWSFINRIKGNLGIINKERNHQGFINTPLGT